MSFRFPFQILPRLTRRAQTSWTVSISTNLGGSIIGVLFGCFGRTKLMAIPGLPGGLIIYQDHLFAPKGHLRASYVQGGHSQFETDPTD